VLVLLIAGVIALILNPLVKLLERRGFLHGVAVFAVYIGLLATLAGGQPARRARALAWRHEPSAPPDTPPP